MLRLFASVFACAMLLHADTEDTVRKTVPVDSATKLILTADIGGIEVRTANVHDVEVEVWFRGDPASRTEFDKMLRDFHLDVTRENSGIRISGKFHEGWKPRSAFGIFDRVAFGWGHTICHNKECLEYSGWLREVTYRITVPRSFNADLDTWSGPISVRDLKGSVDAHTSGGPLEFQDIEGPVNGRTSGGPITLERGKGQTMVRTAGGPIRITELAGDVDASTSGGPILIERASGRVRARTSGGPIDIQDAKGSVDASTSGGAVMASFAAQPNEECRLRSSGGSIDVRLSKDVHMDLDASTSAGRVSTNFAVPDNGESHAVHAPLNGGGPLLYLRTAAGGITVRRD